MDVHAHADSEKLTSTLDAVAGPSGYLFGWRTLALLARVVQGGRGKWGRALAVLP